jgi:hypothetical protein
VADVVAHPVRVLDEAEPAVGRVRDVVALGDDPDGLVVDVELASALLLEVFLLDLAVTVLRLRLGDLGRLDDFARLVDLLRDDGLGRSVEVRILEQLGCARVVDDLEAQLVLVGLETGAAADDLLEVDDRADRLEEHDVLHGRQIDPGGEQLRGCRDHRRY